MTAKTCLHAFQVLAAVLSLTLTTCALAQPGKPVIPVSEGDATTGGRDDLFPPWWRGAPGTTVQHWTFDSDQAPHWVPEYHVNPYGEPWMHTQYSDEEWYSYWEGRSGVVQPWNNLVYLNLPNTDEPLDWKIVWVQLTWRHGTGALIPPEFQQAQPPGELVWQQHIPLGYGWHHTVYEIWIPGNPDFETIMIESDHWFDQIVVDTWCSPLEPRGACCIDGECVATVSCRDCLSSGGWWYQGEDCDSYPPFECPCRDALWHNGEPDLDNAIACQRGLDDPIEAWVVDDVTFEEPIVIRDLHWWAATEDAYDWQNTDDIIILAGDGPEGGPGTVLVQMWDVPNMRYDTCYDMQGRSAYVYRIDGLEIVLPAGTYWIGVRPVSQGSDGQSFNMTSATGDEVVQDCYFKSEFFGVPDWTVYHELFGGRHDIAFCVNGELAGACCVDGDCVELTSSDKCEAMGGLWYETRACPEFDCPCRDDSIWDNGVPDYAHAMRCERYEGTEWAAWIADDVTFEEDVVVEGLHWWAATTCQYSWLNTGDLIILAADGPDGGPGTVVAEMWDVPATDLFMAFPNPWDYPQFYYSMEGLHIPLTAGTYWVGMRPVSENNMGFDNYNISSPPNGTSSAWYQSDSWGVPDWKPFADVWGYEFYAAFCVTGVIEQCPADFDGNGVVDTADLLFLLGAWGTPDGDVNDDGTTNTADLLILLGEWGECP